MQGLYRISPIQLLVLLVSMMMGVGILTLPRGVTDAVGTPDGWIAVILAGLLTTIPVAAIGKLSAVFPRQHFLHYSQEIAGKHLGWLLGFLYSCYFIMFLAFEVRVLGEVVRQYLMDKTPKEVLIVMAFFSSVYLVTGGLGSVVRINQLFLPIMVVVILTVFLLSVQNFEMKNVQPILSKGFSPLAKGIPQATLSYLGFDILLVFSAYLEKPEKAVLMGIMAVAIVCVIYTVNVFLGIGTFGAETLVTLIWPTLEMVKGIEIPGGFVERLESLFLTIWIMAIFTTLSIMHFLASLILGQLFNRDQRWFSYAILPVSYIVTMSPKGLIDVFAFGAFLSNIGIFFAGAVPILLLLIARIRRLGTYAEK
ncbi:GerAB/ArcD/ProY family transporter [Effusibacillus consociatus]|uniref:GerAB/ArcD/ProY family transporter n=1 Tax=Effusibacillus consociatus TaxID=1117041 RepID=A0ABV9Q718_9BACL